MVICSKNLISATLIRTCPSTWLGQKYLTPNSYLVNKFIEIMLPPISKKCLINLPMRHCPKCKQVKYGYIWVKIEISPSNMYYYWGLPLSLKKSMSKKFSFFDFKTGEPIPFWWYESIFVVVCYTVSSNPLKLSIWLNPQTMNLT